MKQRNKETMKQRNNETMKHKNNEAGVFHCFFASLFPCSNDKGFTLIELLIVIGIFVILAAATFPIYGNLQANARLDESSSVLAQRLRLARNRSEAGYNNSRHGVYFLKNAEGNRDKYVLYQGPSYSSRDSSHDYSTLLKSGLDLSLPGGGSSYEINFSQGLADPSATGTVMIGHETKGSVDIIIKESGAVWKQ
ncbi:MAG TPA: type II secretion system protein [Patescibacteria group bacterium]|nr:type II secretion system protein [Patescibacteria group bacterium]